MLVNPFLQSIHSSLFSDPEIELFWSAQHQMRHYINYELAWTRALAHAGLINRVDEEAALAKLSAFEPDTKALDEAIAKDGVALPGLVFQMRDGLANSKAIHDGSTSQDVIDTALSLTVNDINIYLENQLKDIVSLLVDMRAKFGSQKVMAATRMQDALMIDASHRLENWLRPLSDLLDEIGEHTFPLQTGGAVGDNQALADNADQILSHLAQQLNLNRPKHSWHTDRSRIVKYSGFLARLSGALGKIGQDICLMAYKNNGEIELANAGGSSAMPNKQNPISAELLVTLAKFNAGQSGTITQSLIHENERSGSSWMLEWMILPTMTLVASHSLKTANKLLSDVSSLGQ